MTKQGDCSHCNPSRKFRSKTKEVLDFTLQEKDLDDQGNIEAVFLAHYSQHIEYHGLGYDFLDTYCTLLLIDRREVESAGEIINMSGSFSRSNKRKEDVRSRKLPIFIFASPSAADKQCKAASCRLMRKGRYQQTLIGMSS